MTEWTAHPISRDEWLHILNRAAQDYAKSAWFRETVVGTARLRKHAFATARGAILDVACGHGESFAVLPADSPIVGVDFSPVMLDLDGQIAAHRRFRREWPSAASEANATRSWNDDNKRSA